MAILFEEFEVYKDKKTKLSDTMKVQYPELFLNVGLLYGYLSKVRNSSGIQDTWGPRHNHSIEG